MKHCNKCGVELVEGDNWWPSFVKKQYCRCIECSKASHRQWCQENVGKIAEYNYQRYQERPDYFRKRSLDYYRRHRAVVCERKQCWREANPGYKRQWRAENPDKSRGYDQRRRMRKAGLPATLTGGQWQEILEQHDHACAYCGRADLPLEQEHMMPVSRGGGYTAANIVPACGPCNSSKGTKTYEEFLQQKK